MTGLSSAAWHNENPVFACAACPEHELRAIGGPSQISELRRDEQFDGGTARDALNHQFPFRGCLGNICDVFAVRGNGSSARLAGKGELFVNWHRNRAASFR